MRHLADEYPVRWLCRLLGCGRAGVYRAPTEPADEAALRRAVEALAGAWPTYGHRRLTALLRREGWVINPKRVRRVMRELGLAAEPAKRRVRTTNSDHPSPGTPTSWRTWRSSARTRCGWPTWSGWSASRPWSWPP